MRINKRQIGSRFGCYNKAGHHTDDTSMALCLAESLIVKGTFDAKDQLERYCMWMDSGHMSSNGKCEGMGRTTRNALNAFKLKGHTKTRVYDPLLAGNGSIMRLAPIPMFYGSDVETTARFNSILSSSTTHIHKECGIACNILGGMIHRALLGYGKEEIFHLSDWQEASLMGSEVGDVMLRKTYLKEPPYIVGSGHVVKSLEAALWAFHKSTSFKHGVLLAVNLGDDADTTAAIYGQLAGAYYGYSAIPKIWVNTLIKRVLIKKYATELYKLANGKTKISVRKEKGKTIVKGTGSKRSIKGSKKITA